MNRQNYLEQQFGCSQNGCGQHDRLCDTCAKFYKDSTTTKCPDGNLYCSNEIPCDYCQSIAQSVVETNGPAIGGGKARDVEPLQGVHGSSNHDGCSDCGKPLGSNPQNCVMCKSFSETPLNPAQPPINYDPNFGPLEGSFGPCTQETTISTLENFQRSFDASKKHGFQFTGIDKFKRRASLICGLLSNGTILGIEGFNYSCFYVVVFWMLSQGNMHERINTDCLSGYILYKILWDLRAGLFVGRDIVEAFRLSLQEYPLVQRSKSDFEKSMDDFTYLLGLLEDNEVGILRKDGPMLSHTGCSFHVHESIAVKHASIQEALCASMKSPSPVLQDCSIISFQFCQQKTQKGDKFTRQTLGTDFEFPCDGIIVNGKLFRPKMFIIYIYGEKHYLVVLCIGESYFLANSLSAFQCGHFLPEMREISEQEAMGLFRTQVHTIVFECIGNAYAPPPLVPSTQVAQVPPPPPQVPCASGPLVPSPPPPASSAQVSQAFPPLPPPQVHCAKVDQAIHQSPASSEKITQNDIVVSGEKWSCRGRDFAGRIEKMPHPTYPKFLMEVYFYETASKTTLEELVGFLNFIESIQ